MFGRQDPPQGRPLNPRIKTYQYTNLHVHLYGQARELLDRTDTRSDTPRLERPALGAIILAATAIDAAVNHLVSISFPPGDLKTDEPVQWLAKRLIDNARPAKKRLELLAAYLRVAFEKGADPWMSAGDLGELRNVLVHYPARPIISSEQGAIFDVEGLRPLAQRLGLIKIHDDHGGTWLDVFVNRDCAEWAVSTTETVLRALDAPPWRKVPGGKRGHR